MTSPKYYFYRKDRELFSVNKNINGKIIHFGSYPTEKMAKQVVKKLKEVNWDKSELKRIQSEVGAEDNFQIENPRTNYVYDKTRGSYRVSKIIKGRRISFGEYVNEYEAKQVVDLLNYYGWKKENLPKIYDMLGFEGKKRKNYHFNKKNNCWTVYHKGVSYGNYKTEDEAKIIVEELRKNGWDRSKIKDIWWDKQILGTINCKPKYYYYRKDKDQYEVKFGDIHIGYFVTEKAAQEAVEKYKPAYLTGQLKKKKKKKARFYYKEGNNYRVRRRINGKTINFGSYPSEDLAKKVVEKLTENDWDKEKLDDILKELEV